MEEDSLLKISIAKQEIESLKKAKEDEATMFNEQICSLKSQHDSLKEAEKIKYNQLENNLQAQIQTLNNNFEEK